MTHPALVKAFLVLKKSYPNWKLDAETVAVWEAVLSDTPADNLLRAALEWVRTPAEFPPTIGQLRALATKPDEARLTPEEAWGEVISEIRRVGWIGTPVWSSDAIARAARALGSWRTLCSQRTDELAANRAHFFRIYAAFSAKQARRSEQLAMAPIVNLMTGKSTMLQGHEAMYGTKPGELETAEHEERDLHAEDDERLRKYELGEDIP